MSSSNLFKTLLLLISIFVILQEAFSIIDYGAALTKSLLYFEAQRSGKLPPKQRLQWRGDSALNDGATAHVDLVGGYYDAGDNVKFGFPMAFTITMLSWSVVEFGKHLEAKKELSNALEAIKWGTDYLLKAHAGPKLLYAQVGDGDSDHVCWQRPEDMTTPRTVFSIDAGHPGSDLAGETAAAFASASIAFNRSNPRYSQQLLSHAISLFEFAKFSQGKYSDSIHAAAEFYSSSGYQDELSWAAAWIIRATDDSSAMDYLHGAETGGDQTIFSWDDKYAGAHVLIAKLVQERRLQKTDQKWTQYHDLAERYICNSIGKGNSNFKKTNGALLWFQDWNNLQYTTATLFLVQAYSEYLSNSGINTLQCSQPVTLSDLHNFVQNQVDYILGENPKKMSYMVGFGSNYPKKVHHRGASIVSIKTDRTPVECKKGFEVWYRRDAPNPNVLEGAIVGGPDQSDGYVDDRDNYRQSEPATANTAPLVGVLAKLAAP